MCSGAGPPWAAGCHPAGLFCATCGTPLRVVSEGGVSLFIHRFLRLVLKNSPRDTDPYLPPIHTGCGVLYSPKMSKTRSPFSQSHQQSEL